MLVTRGARGRAWAVAPAFLAAAVFAWLPSGARAEESTAFREIETKYIFGFTEGSGIGLEGEKEVSAETVARFGRRDGRYFATETKLEFEFTPTQFTQLEFGPLIASHDIKGVTGLDDRNNAGFSGLFGEFRYLLIGRGPESPIGLTLSLEPEFHRIDETSGERVSSFALETKLNFDTELVPNRLFLGANLLYEPEATREESGERERESTLGLSAALAYRVTPPLLLGAELGYFRHYDSIGLHDFTGDALFLGPTLYLQLSRKTFLTAAFSKQIAGREVDGPNSLDLADFPRYRAKLKLGFEF